VSEPAGENGTIRYSVKELLAKVDVKLDAISSKLDAKADAHDLHAVDARVAALEKEAVELRAVAAEKKNRFTRTEKVIGLTYFGCQLAIGIAALGPDIIG
jgi:hypothetical protein